MNQGHPEVRPGLEHRESPPVRNTEIAFGYGLLAETARAREKFNQEPNGDLRQWREKQLEAIAAVLDRTQRSEASGHPIGMEEAKMGAEDQFEVPPAADKAYLLRSWAHTIGMESVAPDKSREDRLLTLLDQALNDIKEGKLPAIDQRTSGMVTYFRDILPRIKNPVLLKVMQLIDNGRTDDPSRPGDENKPLFREEDMAEFINKWVGNAQIPEAEQLAILDADEARRAAGPSPQEQVEEAMRRATAAYQQKYYEKAYILDEAQQAIRFMAQAMTARQGEQASFGLSVDQSIDVQTVRALSPDALRDLEGVQRALGILTAALEETSNVKAPEFKSVTSVLGFNLEEAAKMERADGRAGWTELERGKIIDMINFIYYSTIYNSAAKDCDREFNQWAAKIKAQTQTSEKQSKDEFKLSSDMIVAAFESFREVEGRKEYLLPHLREVTDFLNDPAIIYELQRYKYGERGNSKNPEKWVEDNIVKPLKTGNWNKVGGRKNYQINVNEGGFRGQIIEEVRLAFRYWQGAGFENEWKNTPVMGIDHRGRIVDDVSGPTRRAQIVRYRPVFSMTPEQLEKRNDRGQIEHPYRSGFFGTECDDPFGTLRRPAQFIQGIKLQLLPNLGSDRRETMGVINLASELVRNLNRFGKNWMSYGGLAIHHLYAGRADSIASFRDEVSGVPYDQRPLDPNPFPVNNLFLSRIGMSDLLAFSVKNKLEIDPVRTLWKKANAIDAANGPLIGLALKTKSPKDFGEFVISTTTPIVNEAARDPAEETGARKALQAEVILADYVPAIAAVWVAEGRGHRIFQDELDGFFEFTKRQNLWHEDNVGTGGAVSSIAFKTIFGDGSRGAARNMSEQGRKLRGVVAEMIMIAYLIEKGDEVIAGQSAMSLLRTIAKVMPPKLN